MDDLLQVKIIVVGDSNVGKTSLLSQYCWNQFKAETIPTIGCDFTTKIISKGAHQYKLQLWDIAGTQSRQCWKQGQEQFQSISKLFIRGSLGCLVVCDITKQNTLMSSAGWKNIVEAHSEHSTMLPIVLIQNKLDLVADKEDLEPYQTKRVLERYATSHGFKRCFQLSVKDAYQLHDVFDGLLDDIWANKLIRLEMNNSEFERPRSLSSLSTKPRQQHRSCC